MSQKENNDKSKETKAEIKDELKACEAEGKDQEKEYLALQDKFVRLAAEFDNARKRWDRDRDDLLKFGEASLLRDIIPVIDELEQALIMAKEHADSDKIVKGLEMTCSNFLKILKKRGLEPIETAGKKFDPHSHEIAGSCPVADEKDEHKVMQEIQKGYLFNDKVLRTSKVVVGMVVKAKPETGLQKIEDKDIKPESGENNGLGEA
jgi:molecular chaperone GrpE